MPQSLLQVVESRGFSALVPPSSLLRTASSCSAHRCIWRAAAVSVGPVTVERKEEGRDEGREEGGERGREGGGWRGKGREEGGREGGESGGETGGRKEGEEGKEREGSNEAGTSSNIISLPLSIAILSH